MKANKKILEEQEYLDNTLVRIKLLEVTINAQKNELNRIIERGRFIIKFYLTFLAVLLIFFALFLVAGIIL